MVARSSGSITSLINGDELHVWSDYLVEYDQAPQQPDPFEQRPKERPTATPKRNSLELRSSSRSTSSEAPSAEPAPPLLGVVHLFVSEQKILMAVQNLFGAAQILLRAVQHLYEEKNVFVKEKDLVAELNSEGG